MFNFLASVVLASLLIPTGFNFLTQRAVDYSYVDETLQQDQTPQRIINTSFGLKTTAKSILVIDDATGTILYNKNSTAVLPIASITKLMTALVILDNNPNWDEEVEILEDDHREGGMVYLLTGEKVIVKDLFYLMLTSSSNEAAVAIARNYGIENFISMMNKKAAELEMTETYFLGPSGIEPENISSPFDLVKFAEVVFSREEITKALATKVYEFTVLNTQRLGQATNNNQLVNSFLNNGDYQIIGAKTGYLDEAGYCLLLKIKKDDITLTVVLLGAQTITDRWQEAKGLVDWVFDNYVWPE